LVEGGDFLSGVLKKYYPFLAEFLALIESEIVSV
jgi:hypothetical protein